MPTIAEPPQRVHRSGSGAGPNRESKGLRNYRQKKAARAKRLFVSRSASHLATDYRGDRYEQLQRLGCREPQPIIDHQGTGGEGSPFMILCGETGNCFALSEATDETQWIPGPVELIRRRNAIRNGWTLEETNSRDVTQADTLEGRRQNRLVEIQIASLPSIE